MHPATKTGEDYISCSGPVRKGNRQLWGQAQAQGPRGRGMGEPKQEDGRKGHQVGHETGRHSWGQRKGGMGQRKALWRKETELRVYAEQD